MSQENEARIWIVVTTNGEDGRVSASAYDNEPDARNYFIEMRSRYGEKGAHIQETVINSRDSSLPYIDAPWGFLRMDLNSEFVEGLMEDMSPSGRVKPGAVEQFASERAAAVSQRMLKRVEGIFADEIKEELKSHEEWRFWTDMED
jgi:hypothetical protein